MSNICAGIGRGQMEVLDKHITLRREMHEFYQSLFATIESVTVFNTPNEDYFSNYWLTTILIDPLKSKGRNREDLRVFLENLNIESRPLWKPMHMQPVLKNILTMVEMLLRSYLKMVCVYHQVLI